ncbi:Mitochondrial uncoupling protein 5 [Cocos nucifera]|uniref:Mitochondrial uncoupling protein 5 n=1 Tax=Cocos nucifera TaxID=13894 RepID=A0A8K0MV20_COCNU|nr:Mitochondrial uncoupling protein 5 [Cocos nucifera]
MQLQGESLSPAASALRPALAVPTTTTVTLPPPLRPSPLTVGAQILHSEGPSALFSGVSATVLRQTLYTTRMGLYNILKKKWSPTSDGSALPIHRKIAVGLIAGRISAAVRNPADVAMVRMQANGWLPAAERRNYNSVVDAIGRMLATYDQAKEAILARGVMEDGLGTHATASFAAGLVAAMASNPVDVVKTRMMNMKVEKGAPPPYARALDCMLKTVRAERPMALYNGFIPTVSRQGPFTVVLFVTLKQVRNLLKDF